MGKKVFGDYYLGLDIGTGSVGWAVPDLDYNVLRFKGNAMWGVRLFDDAKTAVERRTARIARRRLERRHQRLALLQDLFADQIAKVDPSFFLRLNESGLHPADKKCEGKDSLFHDKGFTDRDYHKKYPTIYHLRWDLMNSQKPHDVRLVYLAIHHIIKSRGHFLFQGDLDSTETLPGIMRDLTDDLEREFAFDAASIDIDAIAKILSNRDLRLTDKQKKLSAAIPAKDKDPRNTKRRKEFIKALSGAKFKIKDLFPELDASALDKDSVDLGSDEYDAESAKYEALLGEDFLFLEKLKAIYDWALLEKTLHGYQYLSKAKVDTYEQHGKDLKLLKSVLRKYGDRSAYYAMFRDPASAGNYCAYAGIATVGGKKHVIEKRCTQEDFLKTVKKALAIDSAKGDPVVQDILARCETGTFMPKATTKDNGVIPYQLH